MIEIHTHERNASAIVRLMQDTYPEGWVVAIPSVLFGYYTVRTFPEG